MKDILEMSVDEKERRVCEALGCPQSRMRHFAAIDREAYNHLCDFWPLLLPRDVLSPRMLSIDMDAGDMLFAGGPVQHCGSGHPKGKLRPVVFATVAGEYNIDFQVLCNGSVIFFFPFGDFIFRCRLASTRCCWRGMRGGLASWRPWRRRSAGQIRLATSPIGKVSSFRSARSWLLSRKPRSASRTPRASRCSSRTGRWSSSRRTWRRTRNCDSTLICAPGSC